MTGSNHIKLKNERNPEEYDKDDTNYSGSDVSDDDDEGSPRFWTEEEDQALKDAVDMYGRKNWKNIAAVVPRRSHVQCLQRWNKVLRPGLVKGSWSEEEDNILREAVLRTGARTSKDNWKCNWSQISELVPGRTAKQCRERWRCNLDPEINKSEWTEEEDKTLLDLQTSIGNRWALIAKSLPGRTENAIKTRFRSIQRAKRKEWSAEEDRIILEMRTQKGCRWETISAALPNRTKNGVKVRHKQLMQEQYSKKSGQMQKRKRKPQDDDESSAIVKKIILTREKSDDAKKDGKKHTKRSASDVNDFGNKIKESKMNGAFLNTTSAQATDPNLFKALAQIYPSNGSPFFCVPYQVVNNQGTNSPDPVKEAECRAAATLLNMAGVLPKTGVINNSLQGFQLLHA